MTYIYLVSNINNNPQNIYVGKTINYKQRCFGHFNRFGDCINIEIIDQIDSNELEAWKPLECKWINHYKSLGYHLTNINEGGNGPKQHSIETKKKISDSKIGNKYRLGHKLSDESKKKITDSKTGMKYNSSKKGNEHGNFGKVRSNEVRYNQSERMKNIVFDWGKNISIGKMGKGLKPILQLDLDSNFIQEFPSLKAAAESINKNTGCISAACSGKQKTAFGFIWRYKLNFVY